MISFLGNAQIVNIPDANFKAKLLAANSSNSIAINSAGNNLKIDTNDDGEIQVSEALNVYEIYVGSSNINNLNGILNFSNLKKINCSFNNINSLNLSGLISLENLECEYNQLTFLNISNLINLKKLKCDYNNLTQLNLLNLDNLETLSAGSNLLTLLITDNSLINLINLSLNYNQFTTFNFDDFTALKFFSCYNNQLQNVDMSNLTELIGYSLNNNALETLIIKNGKIHNSSSSNFSGNYNLNYICVDEANINTYQNKISNYGFSNCHINSYCSFFPGGTFYAIQGNVKYDSNSNSCDISDINYPNLNCSITDGTNSGSLISNFSGNYAVPVQAGNYTITPNLENPSYFNISPTNFTVDFPTQGTPFTQDFCVTANGVHSDVEIVLVPTTPARPGFDATYKLVYRNKGNQIENGTVTFSMYNPDVVDFVSSLPNFNSQTTNPTLETFSWNYSNLQPFETREIYIVLNINSPMETPPVNGGDLLSFDTQIVTSNTDENLNDNFFAIRQVVVNSYDPNDKTCLQGETIPPSEVGKYVHYVIRFENTGTFPAENIVVKDLIDLAKYDIATLVPLNSSHDFYTRINGNKVEFIFENINLDFNDATNDGYVAYKIKTLPSLVLGDTFTNNANIYFDYNFPITTNTYTTTVAALSTQEFDFGTYFTLYPNPANDVLNIQTQQDLPVNSIEIYNQLGQVVLAVTNSVNSIDVADLASGTYFVKVNTEKGSANSKFVKE